MIQISGSHSRYAVKRMRDPFLRKVRLATAHASVVWLTWWSLPAFGEIQEIRGEDGSAYIGEVQENLRHGQGRQTWSDGRVYEGQFKDDQMHDTGGYMSWPDGRSYRGSFVRNLREGTATMIWPNGNSYTGNFRASRISGQGTFTWAQSGDKYTGSFINGVRQGFGTYLWNDGRRYEGEFMENKETGWGTYIHDRTTFRGQFRDGVRHGVGIWTAEEKRWYQIWEDGVRKESALLTPVSHCRLQINDKPWMFRGENCINGLAHGQGLAASLDGRFFIRNGRFVLGRLVVGVPQRMDSAGAP